MRTVRPSAGANGSTRRVSVLYRRNSDMSDADREAQRLRARKLCDGERGWDEGDDSRPIERELDAQSQVARHVIATVRIDTRDGSQGNGARSELFDAQDSRRIQQGVGPGGVAPKFVGGIDHRLLGAVHVPPRDLDVDRDPPPGARQVGDLGDLAIRDDVQRAGGVPQVDEAQGDVLDGALDGTDANDVAERELMLELEEEAGNEVAHEALRPERDSEADDPRAGEQRRDVEAELPQNQQQRDDDEHGTTDVPEQLRGGSGPLLSRTVQVRLPIL